MGRIGQMGRDSDSTGAVVAQGECKVVLVVSLLTTFREEHHLDISAFKPKAVGLENQQP